MCYVNISHPTINNAIPNNAFYYVTFRVSWTCAVNPLTCQRLALLRSLSLSVSWRHSYKHSSVLIVIVLLFPRFIYPPYTPLRGAGPPKSAASQQPRSPARQATRPSAKPEPSKASQFPPLLYLIPAAWLALHALRRAPDVKQSRARSPCLFFAPCLQSIDSRTQNNSKSAYFCDILYLFSAFSVVNLPFLRRGFRLAPLYIICYTILIAERQHKEVRL